MADGSFEEFYEATYGRLLRLLVLVTGVTSLANGRDFVTDLKDFLRVEARPFAMAFGMAPILLVVGYVSNINADPFSGDQGQATLPTVIYNTYTSSQQASNDRTWSAALLLIIIIMLLNVIARLIAWWKKPGRA